VIFVTDIFELQQNRNIKINLIGASLPNSSDVFFRAKQEEVFQQYESARIFLRETKTDDWNHWFQNCNTEYQEVFELLFTERMFESSLMFYNIVVDLSWVLCYVSAEYALYQKDGTISMCSMLNIEEAYKLLRKAENVVTNPNCQGNQFEYLKTMCPEFKDSINLVIDFWKNFSDANIRTLYNFIKHKGKPLYEEVENHRKSRVLGLIMNNENCPTDIRDVQKVISLKDSIQELIEFDDNVLFPYIKELYELLEIAIKPSPFIF